MPNPNQLYEDMAKLNALYEELLWDADDVLEFSADYKNNQIVIRNKTTDEDGTERLDLNSINFTKENLAEDPEAIKSYPPYIINRCLSGHLDCILFANEMNKNHQLSKDMQYSFYLNTLRKKKRFSP